MISRSGYVLPSYKFGLLDLVGLAHNFVEIEIIKITKNRKAR